MLLGEDVPCATERSIQTKLEISQVNLNRKTLMRNAKAYRRNSEFSEFPRLFAHKTQLRSSQIATNVWTHAQVSHLVAVSEIRFSSRIRIFRATFSGLAI